MKNKKVNIFTSSDLSIIELSLKKGILPIKYSYKTKQWAKYWSEIEKIRAKNNWRHVESELLENNIDLYLNELWNPSEICFFDFWCWVWNTIKPTIVKCLEKGIKVNYHWFDISEEIIKLAKENIWKLWKNYNFETEILDFEIDNLSNKLNIIRQGYNNIPVIWMVLWNTIWNFDSMERILINIMSAFRIEDRLILWIEKKQDDIEKILEWYKLKIVKKLTTSLVNFIWISELKYLYKIIFNKEKSRVEWYIKLKEDIITNINIKLKKWMKIQIFKSRKMNELELSKLFLELDYRIASLRTNKKDTFVQIMIGNKEYY